MKRKFKLSASIMCANLLNLEKDLTILHRKNIDYLHFDIMDGHFVPMVGLGIFFMEQLAQKQPIPIEAHLMVTDPEKYIDEIAEAGASMITFHYETGKDIYSTLLKIKRHNIMSGIALRPCSQINVVEPFIDLIDMILLMAYSPGTRNQKPFPFFERRIKALDELLARLKKTHIDIAIDGGLSEANISKYKDYGANFFIVGSSGLFMPDRKLDIQFDKIRGILAV